MFSPSGISLHALVSFLRFVRHVLRQFLRVVGTAARHFDSFVSHFVAHFTPSVPAKHWANALWKAFKQSSCVPAQCLKACLASLMQARVSGLNGCGNSVVLVELDVLVLVVVVAVCACPVSPSNTVL